MQKTNITVGTHEKMKELGFKAAQAGITAEPTIHPALIVLLSPEAIAEMKASYAEGYAEAEQKSAAS